MTNEIRMFNNEKFGSIRIMQINGEPWFVGKDVAVILGYSDTAKAIRVHVDEEDKQLFKVDETATFTTSNYGIYIINESGLYSLILSSKLPTAKEFKRWVTSEVLPSIRKTGGYGMPDFSNATITIAMSKETEEKYKELLNLKLDNEKRRAEADELKSPFTRFSKWKDFTFTKLNALVSYKQEENPKYNLKWAIREIVIETEDRYDINFQDYQKKAIADYNLSKAPYILQTIEYYDELRNSFTDTLEKTLTEFGIDVVVPMVIYDSRTHKAVGVDSRYNGVSGYDKSEVFDLKRKALDATYKANCPELARLVGVFDD